VNKELGGIWKEVVIAYCQVLSWNLPDGTEENHEDLHQDGLYSSQNSKWMASK
jgi:hypothetical protein